MGCNSSDKGVLNGFNIPVLEDKEVLINQLNSNMRQLTIKTIEEFPNNKLSVMYQGIILDQGFVNCNSELEKWDTFLDGTLSPNVRAFRKVNYFINYELKILSVILVSYNSEDINSEIKPDNNNQFITILLYELDSIRNELRRLNISC